MQLISVAKAKSQLSDLLAKSKYNQERFIITRRDKPVAALVSLEDLKMIEQAEKSRGLVAVANQWRGFNEIAETLDDLESVRGGGGKGRDVSF